MQIMEGDVIAHDPGESRSTSRHYHTGGVPGRHEIDETQELNYPAIMKAIVETGLQGLCRRRSSSRRSRTSWRR